MNAEDSDELSPPDKALPPTPVLPPGDARPPPAPALAPTGEALPPPPTLPALPIDPAWEETSLLLALAPVRRAVERSSTRCCLASLSGGDAHHEHVGKGGKVRPCG